MGSHLGIPRNNRCFHKNSLEFRESGNIPRKSTQNNSTEISKILNEFYEIISSLKNSMKIRE